MTTASLLDLFLIFVRSQVAGHGLQRVRSTFTLSS